MMFNFSQCDSMKFNLKCLTGDNRLTSNAGNSKWILMKYKIKSFVSM